MYIEQSILWIYPHYYILIIIYSRQQQEIGMFRGWEGSTTRPLQQKGTGPWLRSNACLCVYSQISLQRKKWNCCSHRPETFMLRPIGDSKLPLGMRVRINGVCGCVDVCVCAFMCTSVCPAMDWQPVRGVFLHFRPIRAGIGCSRPRCINRK